MQYRNVPSISFLILLVECLMPQCYMLSISTLLLVVGTICVKGSSVALLSPLPAFITFSLFQKSYPSLHTLRSVQKYPRIYIYICILDASAHLSIIP